MRMIWIAFIVFLYLSAGITELIYEIENGLLFRNQRRFFSRLTGESEEIVDTRLEIWGCGTWFLISLFVGAVVGAVVWVYMLFFR